MSGYFDLQVNGYAGVDFNSDVLTSDDLIHACAQIEADGVSRFLATIITEDLEIMIRRISLLARICSEVPEVAKVMSGIHVEGPFISPETGYVGAHPTDAVRPATVDDANRLVDAGMGLVKLVTLAPEHDAGLRVTKQLANLGIVVAAGHCNPTLDQLRGSIDAGLKLFTHLGNACPAQLPRHDNIVQRALSLHRELKYSFICDGAHIPFFALKNYIEVAGIDRCIAISDAIAPAGLGPGRYTLGRWNVVVGEDMVARSPDGSHLIGSGVTMRETERNLIESVGLSREEVRKMIAGNAGDLMGWLT